MKRHLLTLALTAAGLPALTQAAPFSPFDVRAAGMGGTGVASAKSASAALFNPAMLSAQVEGDKFQFVLGGGASVTNTDFVDEVDGLQKSIDTFQAAVNNYLDPLTPKATVCDLNVTPLAACPAFGILTNLYTSGITVSQQVQAINNQSLLAGIGAGLGVGVPSQKIGVGVFVSGTGFAAASPQVSVADQASLLNYLNVLEDGKVTSTEVTTAATQFSNVSGNVSITNYDPTTSTATGTAIVLTEVGVGFSHRFDLAQGVLSGGLALKSIDASTFDYTANIEQWDDANIDAGNHEQTDSGFDIDAGVIYRTDPANPWQYGLVLKNLLGNEYKTKAGRTIEIGLQARGGIARMTERSTITVDLDLIKNEGIAARGDTQFLAFGAEYDLKYLQLRCGYRANLASSDIEDALSAGLGLGPLDLSVIGNENDIGASLQLGFGW